MSLKQFIHFTSDASGLERILRLLQGVAQIFAAISIAPEDVKTWGLLRGQFALGRRYFRFFRFMDTLLRAWDCFLTSSGLEMLLGVGKWGFLTGYLFLESVTILDVLGAWPTPWAKACFVEANKLWFYSLVCSILAACVQLFYGELEKPHAAKAAGDKEKPASRTDIKARSHAAKDAEKLRSSSSEWRRLIRRLVTDCFDLLIPGSVTGWLVTSPVIAGTTMVISTTLSAKDIWDKYEGKG